MIAPPCLSGEPRKSLAIGWAKDDIQVNAVVPGWIDSELTQGTPPLAELHDPVLAGTWRATGECPRISPGSQCS
jgi:NAD(P)-dependent dehydrogenase (short-subunit alcohol dehydrogenase family)